MKRRILSLDGGGIKGVYTLAFLAKIEEFSGRPINEFFDLIVGTSTGGIIALGLGKGFTANELLDFYCSLGSKIFKGSKLAKCILQVGTSKYSNEPLRNALYEKFGNTKLGESKIRLVIPSQNLNTGDVHLYKTAHHSRFLEDYKVDMVSVALATSAAPTFFPTYKTNNGLPLVDGGMYANNPIAIAAVEAVGILHWDPEDINILSIGCTSEALDIKLAINWKMGLAYWMVKALNLVMKGQSSAAIGMAKHLCNYKVKRIDDPVAKNKFSMDDIKSINTLKGFGQEKGRHEFQNLKDDFFSEPAETFFPEYSIEEVTI